MAVINVQHDLVINHSSEDHWHDILVGSIVGLILAYTSYRQYYPPLGSSHSHRPYSPRIAREPEEDCLPTHHRNRTDRMSQDENVNDGVALADRLGYSEAPVS